MTMLDTELFKTFYVGIITLLALGCMVFLVKSAIESMKRTGGKISSVLDEFVMGIALFAVYFIMVQLPPSDAVKFLVKPIEWFWGLLLGVLRTVGIPV